MVEVIKQKYDHEFSLGYQYLAGIKKGTKTLELRLDTIAYKDVKVGDTIRFFSSRDEVLVTVVSLRKYSNLDEVCSNEDITNLTPEKIIEANCHEFKEKVYSAYRGRGGEEFVTGKNILIWEIILID